MQQSSVALTDMNDPRRSARKIMDQWRIDHKINTAIRRNNGENMPVASDAIGRGDFVEVTVTARIEVIRTRRSQGSKVSFIMHDVVRLWSAQEAKVSEGHIIHDEAHRMHNQHLVNDEQSLSATRNDMTQPTLTMSKVIRLAPLIAVNKAEKKTHAIGPREDTVMETDKD